MTAFHITYRGPAALAVRAATLLADAPGVELTSSDPPQHRDGADAVLLALTVNGTTDAVLDAVGAIRGELGPDARLDIADGGAGRT